MRTVTEQARWYNGRPILVTGGFGFLGLNLVTALRCAGADVRVLARSWPPEGRHARLVDGVRFLKGDLRDEPIVRHAVKDVEIIFDLAARSGAAASNTSPADDLDVNARGQLVLLEACRNANAAVKVIFPSSRLVYEPTDSLPVPETAAKRPRSIYGIHKLLGEQYLLLYAHLYGLQSVILRITNPYGPFQRREQNHYGIVNWFIHLGLNGHRLPVYGQGEQLRDYVHVDDVVCAFLLAGSEPNAAGAVLNIGGNRPVSFREMAEMIVRLTAGPGIDFVPWPEQAARIESGSFVADITRAKETLGWHPEVALEEGLHDVVQRYQADDRNPASR